MKTLMFAGTAPVAQWIERRPSKPYETRIGLVGHWSYLWPLFQRMQGVSSKSPIPTGDASWGEFSRMGGSLGGLVPSPSLPGEDAQ